MVILMNVKRYSVNCWEFEEGITRAIICKEKSRYNHHSTLWVRKFEIKGTIRLLALIERLRRWRKYLIDKYGFKDFP